MGHKQPCEAAPADVGSIAVSRSGNCSSVVLPRGLNQTSGYKTLCDACPSGRERKTPHTFGLSGNCLDDLEVRAGASRAARLESGRSTQRGILVVGPLQRTEHDKHIEVTEFRN